MFVSGIVLCTSELFYLMQTNGLAKMAALVTGGRDSQVRDMMIL